MKRYNKYSNKKTELDGLKFDSKKEMKRYSELKLMEMAGLIEDLILQPVYLIQEGFKLQDGKRRRKIEYLADFEYYDTELQEVVTEDVKGWKTDIYKLKKKLFEYKYKRPIKET